MKNTAMVSIREVYILLDKSKVEIMGAVNQVSANFQHLESKLDTLEAGRLSTLEANFQAYKAEIDPIKKIVYGLVTLILIAVVGAILTLVVMK